MKEAFFFSCFGFASRGISRTVCLDTCIADSRGTRGRAPPTGVWYAQLKIRRWALPITGLLAATAQEYATAGPVGGFEQPNRNFLLTLLP